MSRKAFTLIELLVVVAVLALLASIVFSNLGGAREGARISNALQSQSQIHSLLGSDLIGWWNLNDGSGSVARDLSGYGNNGTIYGGPEWVEGVPGTGGSALEFDGVATKYGRFSLSQPIGNNWSIGIWVYKKSHSVQSYPIFLSFGLPYIANNSASSAFRLSYTNTSGSQVSLSGTTVPQIDDWHHVLVTAGSDLVRIYVNGNLENTTGVLSQDSSSSTFDIGRHYGSNTYRIHGGIDDIRIYNRALTASEIQTLYAQTKDNYLANE